MAPFLLIYWNDALFLALHIFKAVIYDLNIFNIRATFKSLCFVDQLYCLSMTLIIYIWLAFASRNEVWMNWKINKRLENEIRHSMRRISFPEEDKKNEKIEKSKITSAGGKTSKLLGHKCNCPMTQIICF